MGCASSKSTPVIESNGNEDHVKGIMMNNEDTSDENMIQKGKDMMHNLKNDISDMASDLSHKVGSYIHSSNTSKPSTPETERIKMPESDEVNENIHDDEVNETAETDNDESSESVPMRIISIDVDEGNQEQLEENQVPVKVSLSIGDSEDYTAGGEKPPTPMPESVINNAIWPNTLSESNEKPPHLAEEVARSTPLDPIEEEKKYIYPSTDGAAVIEILTIEIAEIPIEDNTELTPENEDNENKEENENINENEN